jgi:hypothetical protein
MEVERLLDGFVILGASLIMKTDIKLKSILSLTPGLRKLEILMKIEVVSYYRMGQR